MSPWKAKNYMKIIDSCPPRTDLSGNQFETSKSAGIIDPEGLEKYSNIEAQKI
jgi:hypothetical protein